MTDFSIRPLYAVDLDAISGRCWDDRATQLRLLARQEILGFGAWDARGANIATLHCYQVALPDWDDTDFPGYGRARLEDWPLGWPLLAARAKGLAFAGMVWGLACFHVGILARAFDPDPAYFRQGIGTALLNAAVAWAREHRYAAVIGHGGTRVVPEYNVMQGSLPWSSYAKLGFVTEALEEDGARLPWWVAQKGPELEAAVQRALAGGASTADIAARLMVLRLG